MSDPKPHPMAVSAHDVAAELRRRLPGIGVTKLHKLLYYAQGWHLTWADGVLFEEPIEAWVNGPVVARLWADEKHNRPRASSHPLDGTMLATLDYVVARYGGFTGQDLARLTHTEDPWRSLSESDDPLAIATPLITHEALKGWFERDEEHVARIARVERLRARTDVYSFGPLPRAPGLETAITRALNGERVRDSRSG